VTQNLEESTIGLAPLDITLEITRKCPLRCNFCSSNGGDPHPKELTLIDWERIVDEAIEIGARSFLISGGEPFSCQYIKELIEYISEKPAQISIYSSGNVEKNNKIEPLALKDLEFIANLGSIKMILSLEGSSNFTHDKITNKMNSFCNTIQSVQNCIKLGLKTEIHFVPTKQNYFELPGVLDISKNLGVDKISILRFVPQGRGKENRKSLELDYEDLIKLNKIFLDFRKYRDFVRIGSPFNPFLLSTNYICTAGINRITIRYDGLVFPCEAFKFLPENEEIDIRKFSLKRIFYDSSIFKEVKTYHKIFLNSSCKSCSGFSICGGGCPAQKILNSTNIDPICLQLIEVKQK